MVIKKEKIQSVNCIFDSNIISDKSVTGHNKCSKNPTVNLSALCNSSTDISCDSSDLIFTFLYARSSIRNASEQLVFRKLRSSCIPTNKNLTELKFGDRNGSNGVTWDRSSTVVKVLCYKSEGRWFDPGWCHWNFSLT